MSAPSLSVTLAVVTAIEEILLSLMSDKNKEQDKRVPYDRDPK